MSVLRAATSRLARQIVNPTATWVMRCTVCSSAVRHQKIPRDATSDQDPIRFTTSGAHKWKSVESFSPPPRVQNQSKYQSIIILVSTCVFLTYFLLLREENDWDEEIGKSLYQRIPGLEERDLMNSIKHQRSMGRSTADLEARLKEVRAEAKL